ncbi:MAG: radical SAM protein [Actinobacteria bacterium]|nr:radical SAM protein [Actinomycetota bacterium]
MSIKLGKIIKSASNLKINKLARIESSSDYLDNLLQNCVLCPHKCKAERKNNKKNGFCGAGYLLRISSALPHYGEEPPISGSKGSGTIFFSHCNMRCVYCQNYQISQELEGRITTIENLSDMMIELQHKTCHNINLVSPTIWIPQIIKSACLAIKKGLNIPIVYNTGGYDNPEIIKMLSGIIDIYMPDMRYSKNSNALKYSSVKDYKAYNRKSIAEMYSQAGDLKLDKNGVAISGLIVRLLVLPEDIAGIKNTLDFIKNELSNTVYLSIMAQYHPEYKSGNYPELSRRINSGEYFEVVNYAEKLGFTNGWVQDYYSIPDEEDLFIPDFKSKGVFKYKR